ncbi:RNA-directed DNA polymerase [Chitinophagaceae bacterium 26-R-25]|nr:RNA-directed DNA polymerase [Chitinophagaceae bacterium 26-R-25]
MELQKLIAEGYLPDEIIPSFNTTTFSNNLSALFSAKTCRFTLPKSTENNLISFSTPKIRNYRRHLAIPHPLYYLLLSNEISENWDDIVETCSQSHLSVSQLLYNTNSKRAIDKPNFEKFIENRIVNATGARYIFKADISKCYDSIDISCLMKLPRNVRKSFANICTISKKMQGGSEISLPIGPDTSRILSEVILSAIDKELQDSIPDLKGLRIVDDYYLYFETLNKVEEAGSTFQQILKKFRLSLNQNKERVYELPEIIEDKWLAEMREFKFRESEVSQRTDIITYFDKAIYYSNQYPEDFVLSYALGRLVKTEIHLSNWTLLQSLLFNCLTIESKIINYIAEFIIDYHPFANKNDEKILILGLGNFLLHHLKLNNDYEILWSLWLFKHLKLKLPSKVLKELEKNTNPFVIILAIDLHHSNLADLKISQWKKYCHKKHLYTEYWILAYEAERNNWFKDLTYLAEDPFFSTLKNQAVSFYDNTANLNKTEHSGESSAYSLAQFSSKAASTEKMLVGNDEDATF